VSATYERPSALADGLALIAQPAATPLAGGTDLVMMRAGRPDADETLVDLKDIEELRGIERSGAAIAIGATTTMAALAGLEGAGVAALADGAAIVGAPQTRNRATVGGNVCRSSPAGDTLAPLVALDATAVLQSAGARRTVAIRDFFTGPGLNVRAPDELLVALTIEQPHGASAYRRLTYRAWMDLAVVGVGVHLRTEAGTCAEASVAIAGAAPTPLLVPAAGEALIGSAFEADAVEAAADAVRAAASPIDDVRGSAEHRLRALGVLTGRVIARARERENEAAA
jgi:CO/xanthine dehydrogenase FAD-binding subunit